MADRLRRILVDDPNSLGGRARARRWLLFSELFPEVEQMRVLDLGGTVQSWHRSPIRPAHLTVLNLVDEGVPSEESVSVVVGDACDALEALESTGSPTSYDLVFSNSLIEHVGGHARREELARQVLQLAPCHWVQTPYRYFPIEPHWLFPGMQFMPASVQTRIAAHWPLMPAKPASFNEARDNILWTELLSTTEMKTYFPTSDILRERVLGLTKSLVAVKGHRMRRP